MLNKLHSKLHRPENGWDPVPSAHAVEYGAAVWQVVDPLMLDDIERWVGGFKGKRILDLGGGPGQYSVALAARGGKVTWHDVSTTYRKMAQEKAGHFGVSDSIEFSLGYMDEAPVLLTEPFDIVFNRICWNYGFGDLSFAKMVYGMVRPGGFAYIDTTHSGFMRDQMSVGARFRTWLNDLTTIKIGHPCPPRGRLARLFMKYPLSRYEVDYRLPFNDRIIFEKCASHQ
jgi:2-polyprenyl-3-methyl-5-hydroxy-6-metoxy-1,4-benzoquinol methylase